MKFNAKDYQSNELFKFIRQGLDETQKDIANKLGISLSSVEKYESGRHDYPFAILMKLAKVYDLDIIIEKKKKDLH